MRIFLEYPAALRLLLAFRLIDAAMRTIEDIESLHNDHLVAVTWCFLLDLNGGKLGCGKGIAVLLRE